ncbi:hemolymph juvenile hormone binding protein (JHBP) [Popillia japonica]|uniref:Hemolymph juvenile hormone binding protein (JHBP) n=1 Tax=Popillia japonica TaxID=7064 RepID=A0AAW1HQZ6_POPJA
MKLFVFLLLAELSISTFGEIKMKLFVFLLAELSISTFGAKLPYYMRRCDLKDPKLNQCIRNHGNQAIPILVRGDSSLGISRLSPVITAKARFNGKRFNLTLSDIFFDNFKDMRIIDTNLDVRTGKYNFSIGCPYLTFNSSYILKDSQILTKTLSGNGRFEMKLADNMMRYSGDLIVRKIGGKNYLKSTNTVLKLESKRMQFRFKNVQSTKPGNEDFIAFLQENWKVIHKKINPNVTEFLKSRIDSVFAAVENNVVIEDIFINSHILTKHFM